MANKLKIYFEMFGRMGIILTMAVIMNRTVWYQNLPLQTLSNASFYVWAISTGFALSLVWLLTPLMNDVSVSGNEQYG